MSNSKSLKLREFRKMLRNFNALDSKMQVSTVLALVEIAIANEDKQDITTKDLEKAMGVMSGTASRNTYYWGDGHKMMSGAFGFVKVEMNPDDRRRRTLNLTEKGKFFINQLTEGTNGST